MYTLSVHTVLHTVCTHCLYTPSVHTVCTHRMFTPSVYTVCICRLYTLSVHTVCTHRLYTSYVHAVCTHSLYMPSVHTVCTHRLYTLSVHAVCTHRLYTPSVHTVCTPRLYTPSTHGQPHYTPARAQQTLPYYTRVGNRLNFHNQPSVWPNQLMINCIIGSWDAILRISAHGRWDEGVISTITPLGV